jgi:hypothetical protein
MGKVIASITMSVEDAIVELHVQCDQKSVQVGVHSASMVDVG